MGKYADIAPLAASVLTDEQIDEECAKVEAAKAAAQAQAEAKPAPEKPALTPEAVKLTIEYARRLGKGNWSDDDPKWMSNGPRDIVAKVNAELGRDSGLTQADVLALRAEWQAIEGVRNAPPAEDPKPAPEPKEEPGDIPPAFDLGKLG